MTLQQISPACSDFSARAQTDAPVSGASSSPGTPFLSVMRSVSGRTASQKTTQETDSSADKPQEKQDEKTPGTALPDTASALAALFAAQAVQQVQAPGATAANAAQAVQQIQAPGVTAANAAQPAQTQNFAAGPVPALSVLPQAQQLPSAQPASPPATAQSSRTAAEGLPQISAALPIPAQAAESSGAANRTSAFPQTVQDTETVPAEGFQSGVPAVPDGAVFQNAQARQDLSGSGGAGNPQVVSGQSVPQAKILSLGASQTQEQGTASRTGTFPPEDSGGTVLTGLSAAPETRSVPQTVKGGGVQTGGSGQNGRDAQTQFPADQASTAAALYTSGKVVVRISGKTAQTTAAPAAQVADSVADGYRNGVKQMTVDLYPESLGKVSVKLTSKDGLLTVQLAADSLKTQDLIASSSGDIRSLLQNATGQNVQVVRPDSSAAQQWYAQDGNSGNRDRQQQSGGQKRDAQEDSSSGVEAISTDDFLSIMRKAAGA